AEKPGGQEISLRILRMQFFADNSDRRPHATELISAGQELLGRLDLSRKSPQDEHVLGAVASTCLAGAGRYSAAKRIAESLLSGTQSGELHSVDHNELLKGLFAAQPFAALDAFFGGPEKRIQAAMSMLRDSSYLQRDPLSEVPEAIFLDWANRDAPR